MKLPDLSYMMKVGQLRYIQAAYEAAEYRNPDILVRNLLSPSQRLGCYLRGRFLLSRLRARPFYYYVLARTRYYDSLFIDAIRDGATLIVNIGCGSDTRAHRFSADLKRQGVTVLECDQSAAISAKRQAAKRHWPTDRVEHLPLDLNDGSWPDFERWLRQNRSAKMLVMMEGVSPYVNEDCFGRFLDLLSRELRPQSEVAYDFKFRGVGEQFGFSDRTNIPFRLSAARDEIAAYHAAHGLVLDKFELSVDLAMRLLPLLPNSGTPLFREDGLARLVVM